VSAKTPTAKAASCDRHEVNEFNREYANQPSHSYEMLSQSFDNADVVRRATNCSNGMRRACLERRA
jgi:hypothetical protein